MAIPPEVLFNRYFQRHFPYVPPVRPEDPDPRLYRGRHDLGGLPLVVQEQLRAIQETFNQALQNEKQGVPEHVAHPPFHVDYVDSSIQNALAFQYEGYSFIAITVPLIYAISNVCRLLSKSATVVRLLGLRPSDEEYNELHGVLFYILAAFIVVHEYTHHVHGHVSSRGGEAILPNEILDTGCEGNMKLQIQEIAADGYSIYHVLANTIDGPGRSWLRALKLDAEHVIVQDEVLFALIVIAVGAYLFVRPAPDLNEIVQLTHPPQAARMNFIMHEAVGWCRQKRPALEAWMEKQFPSLMNAAAEATLGKSGPNVWEAQATFFKSEEGAKYINSLFEGIKAYKQLL